MKDKIKSKKEKRQEAEKDAAKKNQTAPYPTRDELRAETEEAKPEVYFVVYDESGAPIRRIDGSTDAGFQRAAWDLRYPASRVAEHNDDNEEDFPEAADQGPLAVAGSYSVRMFQKLGSAATEIAGPQSFKVTTESTASMNAGDRVAQEQFLRKVTSLYRAVFGAQRSAEEVVTRLKSIREALKQTPAAEKQLGEAAASIEQRDREILRALTGDSALQKRNEPVSTSISDRVTSVLEGERFALTKPTQTHIDSYNVAAEQFSEQLTKLRALVDVDLQKLEKDMESAGAPWTPGRVPEWSER
jgi:hypothetical protein